MNKFLFCLGLSILLLLVSCNAGLYNKPLCTSQNLSSIGNLDSGTYSSTGNKTQELLVNKLESGRYELFQKSDNDKTKLAEFKTCAINNELYAELDFTTTAQDIENDLKAYPFTLAKLVKNEGNEFTFQQLLFDTKKLRANKIKYESKKAGFMQEGTLIYVINNEVNDDTLLSSMIASQEVTTMIRK